MITAIGMPHNRPDGTYFNGKIGTWSVTEESPAVNRSKNRPAGTLVTRPVSFTSEWYVDLWKKAGGIRAKIREKLYHRKITGNVIQHDGATPHTGCAAVELINQYIPGTALSLLSPLRVPI
jgi:hypothetical protein